MSSNSLAHIRTLLARGETGEAIEALLDWTEEQGFSQAHSKLLQLRSRFANYNNQKIAGTLSTEQQDVSSARISQSFIAVLVQLEKGLDIAATTGGSPHPIWRKPILLSTLTLGLFVVGFLLWKGLDTSQEAMQLTVLVHGAKGPQDIILQNEGKIIADLKGDRRIAQIGENGRTHFSEIPVYFKGQRIPILVEAANIEPVYPDSTYLLDGSPVYFAVKSSCSSCRIFGTVRILDQNGKYRFADQAQVRIPGLQLADTTSADGFFEINVPGEQEQQEYVVVVLVNGDIVWEDFITPSPRLPSEILIQQ